MEQRCTPAITVNSAADGVDPDPNVRTLSEAITEAKQPGVTDRTINFAQSIYGSIISITAMLPELTQNITIDGSGSNIEIHRDDNSLDNFRLMSVGANTDCTIKGLTFTNGDPGSGAGDTNGGAIFSAGDLTLQSCTFTDNHAEYGGAIRAFGGHLSISESNFYFNSAHAGGAISVANAALDVSYCDLSANGADGWGGAIEIYNSSGALDAQIYDSFIYDNSAGTAGGGIYSTNSYLILGSGTDIRENYVTDPTGIGGGVYLTGGGGVTYDGVSIGDNSAYLGDGVYRYSSVERFDLGGVTFYGGNDEEVYTP